MGILDIITNRKSVRSYTGEKVTEEQLNTLLAAAEATPVGMGQYGGVHITVVEDPEVLAEVNAAAAKAFGKDDIVALYGAPTYILVSAAVIPNMESIAYANGAMVVHDIALAATEMGIGQCCIWGALGGIMADEALLAKLEIPEGQVPVASIIVGVTEETYDPRTIDQNRIAVSYVR